MKKNQFEGLTGPALIVALNDNADEIVKKEYSIKLTDSQKQEIKDELIENLQKADSLKADLTDYVKTQNASIKTLRGNVSEASKTLRNGFINATGQVYILRDQETRTAYEYDANGNLIEERPLKAKELQGTIHSIARTGTI